MILTMLPRPRAEKDDHLQMRQFLGFHMSRFRCTTLIRFSKLLPFCVQGIDSPQKTSCFIFYMFVPVFVSGGGRQVKKSSSSSSSSSS